MLYFSRCGFEIMRQLLDAAGKDNVHWEGRLQGELEAPGHCTITIVLSPGIMCI